MAEGDGLALLTGGSLLNHVVLQKPRHNPFTHGREGAWRS